MMAVLFVLCLVHVVGVLAVIGAAHQMTRALTAMHHDLQHLVRVTEYGVTVSAKSAAVNEEMAKVVVRTESQAVERLYGTGKKH